jgi:MFS family permease
VAEHAPPGTRGLSTCWIQPTATLGLFLSLIVIMVCRIALGTEAFDAWGWRIPFMVSILLLGISVWIRLRLNESPLFMEMKEQGKGSKAPLRESFAHWPNAKLVLIALFGLTAGQAVVWYTGQFYSLFFLTQTLKVDAQTANILVAWSLVIGSPCFILFGWLSDRIGRKGIILAGCLLAAATYMPIFRGITHYANPALESAVAANPVVVEVPGTTSEGKGCSVQFNPVGTSKFTTPCDVAKAALVKRGVPYRNFTTFTGVTQIRVGSAVVQSYDATAPDAKDRQKAFDADLASLLDGAKYPAKADPATMNKPMVLLLLSVLVIYVTMVYGPIAAILVEMFPTRIRYTSMSLPYHIGNGWFGGFLPITAFAIVAATGNIYSGLWYPIVVSVITLVVGLAFVKETKDVDIATP